MGSLVDVAAHAIIVATVVLWLFDATTLNTLFAGVVSAFLIESYWLVVYGE